MRLKALFIFCLFVCAHYKTQEVLKYEFNNSKDTVLFNEITNVLYVKKGTPVSLDGALKITHIQRKKYAVQVVNNSVDEAQIYIMEELTNPETKEKEKVVIDKLPVRLSKDSLQVEICIGNNTKKIQYSDELEINLCSNIDCDLKIESYNLVINKNLIEAIGSKFTDKIREAINNTKEKEIIQVEVVYKDILNNKKKIISVFEKE